ncbi:MAG: hypothetical protein WBW93_09430 [Steroidobacteraceae bacterium]
MAIARIAKNNKVRFLGLAADTKPTANNGNYPAPSAGDAFLETDTGKVYVYTGAAWSAAVTGAIVVIDL